MPTSEFWAALHAASLGFRSKWLKYYFLFMPEYRLKMRSMDGSFVCAAILMSSLLHQFMNELSFIRVDCISSEISFRKCRRLVETSNRSIMWSEVLLSKGSRYVTDGILVLRRFFPTAEYSFDFLRDSDRQMIATWIRNDLQKRIIKFPFIRSRYVVSIGENPLLLPLFATCTT